MATSTPWGAADYSDKVAPGIMFYGTSRHGGYHLSPKKNAMVPDYMRKANGWYEEDCEWAIVAVVFPIAFRERYGAEIGVKAMNSLRNWYPDEYEKFTGNTLAEGDSYIRDQEIHKKRHANDYVVISATTDKSGKVLCTATIGGVRDFSGAKQFLVPPMEYGVRNQHGFVIDPAKHEEVS